MTPGAAPEATAAPAAPVDARRTDTRERILTAAARMFTARGFAGTSIRDIADELGVTKAALYYHFTSKDEILHEIVDKPLAAIREAIGPPRDLSTAEARREYATDVIEAMSQCSAEVVSVLKDPSLAANLGTEIRGSGLLETLATQLAMGLSGVDDPAQVEPRHLIRAIAAVAAGEAASTQWHVAYPGCERYSDEDKAVLVDIIVTTLEG